MVLVSSPIITYVVDHLRRVGCEIDVHVVADGCINVLARRGKPSKLFNVHLDTVPANANWSHDPFELKITPERVTGLGACDIKGAAAALHSR